MKFEFIRVVSERNCNGDLTSFCISRKLVSHEARTIETVFWTRQEFRLFPFPRQVECVEKIDLSIPRAAISLVQRHSLPLTRRRTRTRKGNRRALFSLCTTSVSFPSGLRTRTVARETRTFRNFSRTRKILGDRRTNSWLFKYLDDPF